MSVIHEALVTVICSCGRYAKQRDTAYAHEKVITFHDLKLAIIESGWTINSNTEEAKCPNCSRKKSISCGHINERGQFQSDKHPGLVPDKIILSFKDPKARRALRTLAEDYEREDAGLSIDIHSRLDSISSFDNISNFHSTIS